MNTQKYRLNVGARGGKTWGETWGKSGGKQGGNPKHRLTGTMQINTTTKIQIHFCGIQGGNTGETQSAHKNTD